MSANSKDTALAFLKAWQENENYLKMLTIAGSISKLFSDNTTPYINYRLVEKLFCKYFQAEDDTLFDTAFDARIGSLGIGIKTFILKRNHSIEKVAEFNKLRRELDKYEGLELAKKLGQFRNERIALSERSYNVTNRIYHIVGRTERALHIFNYDYPLIDIERIKVTSKTEAKNLTFYDGHQHYNFNNSKSVLQMVFTTPPEPNRLILPVEILDDPFKLLEELLLYSEIETEKVAKGEALEKGVDYIILPLYSTQSKEKEVAKKSGLNQWNADGRKRHPDEVYIPIPAKIHKLYPCFFPPRKESFSLLLPNGKALSVSICQEGGKALMSNPNLALGHWLLREVLQLKEQELVTMELLDKYGVDSVLIRKKQKRGETYYTIDLQSGEYESYEEFINEE